MINEWILELDESKGCENKIVQLYAKKTAIMCDSH